MPTYGTPRALTMTLTSLASSSTGVGVQSDVVTSASDTCQDYRIEITIKTSSSALSNDKAAYFDLFVNGDAVTNYDGSSAENLGGGHAAATADSPSNVQSIGAMALPASSTTYRKIIKSLVALSGGVLPEKWGLRGWQFTGQTTDASVGGVTITPYSY